MVTYSRQKERMASSRGQWRRKFKVHLKNSVRMLVGEDFESKDWKVIWAHTVQGS